MKLKLRFKVKLGIRWIKVSLPVPTISVKRLNETEEETKVLKVKPKLIKAKWDLPKRHE